VTTVVLSQMSEVIDPGLELLERQNRFVNEHLRRIFVQIIALSATAPTPQEFDPRKRSSRRSSAGTAKGEQKAAHWLSRIATNTAIDFMRRSARASVLVTSTAPAEPREKARKAGAAAERASRLSGRWIASFEPRSGRR